MKHLFNAHEAQTIDLLDNEMFARLQSNPQELERMVANHNKEWCIIDEVQKVPAILDTVHALIEGKKIKFALTGSSARKLKRGGANLLAGRAFVHKLFPLTHLELGSDFDLDLTLNYGALAKITDFTSARERIAYLRAYTETYLKEEILIEQIIRSLPPFRRFLEISAAQDTEIVNYSNVARDVKSDPKNISGYYTILEDTLLGFFLEPYHTSIRKRQRLSPKFYWFDTGVRRLLCGTIDIAATPKSFEYGSLFESFVINEIYRLLTYSERSFKLSYIRVDQSLEIDLIIERSGLPTYLIEIKSSDFINDNHTSGLKSLARNFPEGRRMILSRDKVTKAIDGITCMHWKAGIAEIGIEQQV